MLEAKLTAFNPWLTTEAVRSIVETLDALPASIEGNRELLSWLRGERAWYDEAEKRHRAVTLIDFDHPAENVFHVTWEWKISFGNQDTVMNALFGTVIKVFLTLLQADDTVSQDDGDSVDRRHLRWSC